MRKRIKIINKVILLTGAGGYIGAVTTKTLLNKGYEVRALDSFYWGLKPLQEFKNNIEIIREDIRNVNPKILNGVHTVIHTAGLSNDPMADFNPSANFEINTTATARLAKICKKNGVKKFIFASSASIYDRARGGNILQDESSNVSPVAAYSLSKFKAEQEIIKIKNNDFCPVIFRQGTVYGYSPRLRYDLVVNTMVKDALNCRRINVFCKGMQWRPLVDVRDVAEAYVRAIECKNLMINGQVFNLLYKNYTMIELARIVKKILKEKFNLDIRIVIDNTPKIGRNYKISSEKLNRYFKWKPKYSVEDAVQDLVKQIKRNTNTDFTHPRYYNIEWMKLLVETSQILSSTDKIF
ncbi:MAG: SDR family oxidoreductase [Patescibacteria group bacterium]